MTVKNGATKVVSATLAGLMAVGTMPVAAFAESAQVANTNDESGVELQSVGQDSDYALASVEAAGDTSFVADGTEHEVTLKSVTTGSGTVINLTEQSDGSYKGDDAEATTFTVTNYKGTDAGTYTLYITANGTKYSGTASLEWKITVPTLEGVTAYEVNDKDADDVSDTTFTYNGKNLEIGLVVNGVKLVEGPDYVVDGVYQGGTSTKIAGDLSAIKNAGNYVIEITGVGKYAGKDEAQTAEVKFTVNKLDLSTADVTIADRADSELPTAADVLINGVPASQITDVDVKLPDTDAYVKNGQYSVTVSAKGSTNVTGSKSVTFNYAGEVLTDANVQYDGKDWTATTEIDTDLDDNDSAKFDASKVAVVADGKALSSDQYSIKVVKVDDEGNETDATVADLTKSGTYKVSVVINAKATNYKYAGGTTSTMTVTVQHKQPAHVYVTYDGELVGNNDSTGTIDHIYDGEAVAPTIVVRDGKGNALTAGTDYTVTYQKQDAKTNEWSDVSEIKEAGTYRILVVPAEGYKLYGTSVKYDSDGNVDKVLSLADVTTVSVRGEYVMPFVSTDDMIDGDHYAYTGNEITPTYYFKTSNNTDNNHRSDDNVYTIDVDVPASAYKVTIRKVKDADGNNVRYSQQVVDSIKDAGTYEITFNDASDDDTYSVVKTTRTVVVSDERTYKDVPADAWYAQAVSDANQQGLMHGYAGTQFFGPEDTLTRAQTAQVMFNLGGGRWNSENYKSETGSYVTPFDDVDGSLWYGQAIAWANAMDVMNGYAGSNNFGPNDTITREQFAITLANYAKQVQKYTAADSSVLDSYADKDSVDSWAEEAVAWAVQNGIMGVNSNLDAKGSITRAQAAAMLVRFNALV